MNGLTILTAFGSYGGFNFSKQKKWSYRICLGWMAITVILADVEKLLEKHMSGKKDSIKDNFYKVNLN